MIVNYLLLSFIRNLLICINCSFVERNNEKKIQGNSVNIKFTYSILLFNFNFYRQHHHRHPPTLSFPSITLSRLVVKITRLIILSARWMKVLLVMTSRNWKNFKISIVTCWKIMLPSWKTKGFWKHSVLKIFGDCFHWC